MALFNSENIEEYIKNGNLSANLLMDIESALNARSINAQDKYNLEKIKQSVVDDYFQINKMLKDIPDNEKLACPFEDKTGYSGGYSFFRGASFLGQHTITILNVDKGFTWHIYVENDGKFSKLKNVAILLKLHIL